MTKEIKYKPTCVTDARLYRAIWLVKEFRKAIEKLIKKEKYDKTKRG